MKSLERKLKLIDRLRSEADSHIWNIFSRYIKEKGILFSGPDDWQYQGESIYFYGEDGCMGCYDKMSLNIPIKFFLDPENSFLELTEEREREKKEKLEKERIAKEQRELAEFKRLSEKFGDHQ